MLLANSGVTAGTRRVSGAGPGVGAGSPGSRLHGKPGMSHWCMQVPPTQNSWAPQVEVQLPPLQVSQSPHVIATQEPPEQV